MAADGTQIKQDIDNNLGNKGYRGIRIFNIITALKNLVDWVTTSINGNLTAWYKVGTTNPIGANSDDAYRTGKSIFGRTTDDGSGAALQATSINANSVGAKTGYVTNLNNGLRLNQDFAIGPAGNDSFRYIKIAQLPTSSGGLRDILRIHAVMGLFGSVSRGLLDLTLGNRDSFSYHYSTQGDLVGCGIICYNQSGAITVYLKLPNDFRCGCVSILHNVQDTVYEAWAEEVPTGTLVFDSTLTATYPPVLTVSKTILAVPGFVRTGTGNSAFKITGVKAASGLTLKTSRYLELALEDGTVLKVAEVN